VTARSCYLGGVDPGVGHFFTTISAAALTGALAALAPALIMGGLSTVRRASLPAASRR
jgi:hypothetical protein